MAERILIVSDPPAAPGYLPRLRALCDYLVKRGHSIVLLTEEYQPLLFAHDYPVRTLRMYSGSTFDWFVKSVRTLLTGWHDRAFSRRAMATIKREKLTFDIVLCTTFNDFPLTAAQRIAEALGVPLVCDIRDLDEQLDDSQYQYRHRAKALMPFRRLYRAVHIRRRNNVLRKADALTTVAPWHAHFLQQFNPEVHLVYNGYDERQFYPEDVRTDAFTVTYIGSLFEWQQDALQLVRQAVAELNSEQPDLSIRLELHTPQSDPVPHDRLGDTIRKSGIMLVLTSTHTHGMLTTKFYEALGCEKPVLCVPSDNGDLEELIRYTNAGIASGSVAAVKQFILDQYREWRQNGFTRQAVQHREQFSRQLQSSAMEHVLLTTLSRSRLTSIIVPVYNAAAYLPACLDSILRQTESGLQIILVDDGSTDGSYAIAQDYAARDPRIELYQIPHAGQSAARNEGMKHAKGGFVAFVDADDTIAPDWCERHLEAINGVDYVQSEAPRNKYQYTVVWGRLYRRKAIENIRFAEGLIYEDILWSVNLWLSGAVCRIIPYKGYRYTANPQSTTSQPHPDRQQQVLRELKARMSNAPLKGQLIILYTIIRLKLHFLKQ